MRSDKSHDFVAEICSARDEYMRSGCAPGVDRVNWTPSKFGEVARAGSLYVRLLGGKEGRNGWPRRSGSCGRCGEENESAAQCRVGHASLCHEVLRRTAV